MPIVSRTREHLSENSILSAENVSVGSANFEVPKYQFKSSEAQEAHWSGPQRVHFVGLFSCYLRKRPKFLYIDFAKLGPIEMYPETGRVLYAVQNSIPWGELAHLL